MNAPAERSGTGGGSTALDTASDPFSKSSVAREPISEPAIRGRNAESAASGANVDLAIST